MLHERRKRILVDMGGFAVAWGNKKKLPRKGAQSDVAMRGDAALVKPGKAPRALWSFMVR